jgi:hypothetical protein
MNAPTSTRKLKLETENQQPAAFANHDALRRLAISDSGFVFDPVSGDSFTVNATGLATLKWLQSRCSLDQAVAATVEQFDVAPRQAERDILDFIMQLRKHCK